MQQKNEDKLILKNIGEVLIKLKWLYNWILVLVIFIRYLYKIYNNQKVDQNMSIKKNIDLKQILSFFVQLFKLI